MTMEMIIAELETLRKRVQDLDLLDSTPVAARYTSTTGQSIPNNTTTIIDYATVDIDTRSAVTTGAAWKFTAPVGGYYAVDAKVMFNATANWADTEALSLLLYKNGVAYSVLSYFENFPTGVNASANGGDVIYLAAGDYIDIRVVQVSGAALTLLSSNALQNHVAIHRIGD